jgi:hypothetical protein
VFPGCYGVYRGFAFFAYFAVKSGCALWLLGVMSRAGNFYNNKYINLVLRK